MIFFRVSKAVWLCLVALTASFSQASSTSPEEAADDKQCEMLKTSLSYTQENAPQDISGVVSIYIKYILRVDVYVC